MYSIEFLTALDRGDQNRAEQMGVLDGGPAQARANAALLYSSVRRLLQLPPKALVLPSRVATAVPFDKRLLNSTLDAARRLSLLRTTESGFVAATTEHLQPPPDDAEDLEAGANRCAVS